MSVRPRPLVLCILDGWGFREDAPDNATTRAKAPNFKEFWATSPHAVLDASEDSVGLPTGQMGNSEVGHMNLGGGRVIFQDLPRIDRAIAANELEAAPALQNLVGALKKSGGVCHLMGLASSGGVHSREDHMIALAQVLSSAGIKVEVHAFLDGRDVPPKSAAESIDVFDKALASIKGASLATLCGRYYAMDRDKRWDRVERAYHLLALGRGARAADAKRAIEESYTAGVYDEFVLPVALGDFQGMKDGDAILFANFRADRAREILTAFCEPAFDGFTREKAFRFTAAVGMVEYSDSLNKFLAAIFPPKNINDSLGEIVSKAGLKQLRIAETEKYPHVTFFLNGGREESFPGEDRILVPSPKVATYDLQPEMSALEVTDKVVEAIESDKYDLIVLNYANPDMVGHTGDLAAAIKAVETIDRCLGRLNAAVRGRGGMILLTADHGNCEIMTNSKTQSPYTAHTLSKVPVMLMGATKDIVRLHDGILADVAPTLLDLMRMPQPEAMTGRSLIVRS